MAQLAHEPTSPPPAAVAPAAVPAAPAADRHSWMLKVARWSANVAMTIVLVTCTTSLVGWEIGNEAMKSIVPSGMAINPMGAALLIAAVLSLLAQCRRTSSTTQQLFGRLLACVITVLAADRLQSLTRGSVPLFKHLTLLTALKLDRMPVLGAVNLLLVGVSLLLLCARRPAARHFAQGLAVVAVAISIVAVLGAAYGAKPFYDSDNAAPIALAGAVCFLLLSGAILCEYPDSGVMRLLTSDTPAGALLRRSLPATAVVPMSLGLLRIAGIHFGLFDPELGMAALVSASIAVFGVIAWLNARQLDRSDSLRRAADTALAAERNLLRQLIDALPDSIYLKDLKGRYVLDNIAHAQFLQTDQKHIEGKTVADFFPAEMAARFSLDDERALSGVAPFSGREEAAVDRHGKPVWLSTTKIPIRDGQGIVTGMVGVSRDITRRRRDEQEMLQLQNFLFSIIENIPMMVFVKDAEQLRFVRFNRAGEDLLGIAREELLGKNDYDFFPRQQADQFAVADRSVLEGRALVDIAAEKIQTRRGERVLHTKKLPILIDGVPKYLLGISEDITDRALVEDQLREQNMRLLELAQKERAAIEALKRAQSQMLQSEKLAGLGELVAGVAHEINNPLSFVSNNVAVLGRDVEAIRRLLAMYQSADAELAKSAPAVASEIAELATAIDLKYTLGNLNELVHRSREGLKRIQQIVKDLRDFARLDEADKQDADINAGVESTVNIIRGRAKDKQVTLEMDLQPLPPVTCYPAKVNQVVMNLVSNAIDACNNGGWVTVRTMLMVDGQAVRVEVADNGSGIPAAVRERIFDPFFTTKPQGHGTGLGLSISYGIVRDHHGTIDVVSEPGKGSTFRVTLPISMTAPAAT